MIKSTVRQLAEMVAPEFTRRKLESRWLWQNAEEFRRGFHQTKSIEERVDYARLSSPFRSNQKRIEIIALLRQLETLEPRRLCEIGAARGGTLALFASVAAPDARILSLDIHYPRTRASLYPRFARRGQKVTCLQSDSHSRATLDRVKRWLNGDSLDFLFIDGDHSYDGVRSDYEMYSPLVRSRGMIALHDVVPDFLTRFGRKTGSDVGEVPRHWSELKQVLPNIVELIEDPDQDGYGIEMIRVPEV